MQHSQAYLTRLMEFYGWTLAQATEYLDNEEAQRAIDMANHYDNDPKYCYPE